MNRREFLAALRRGQSSPQSPLATRDKAMLPIVDTHQHLWDLTQFRLAWFDPKTPEGKILGHSFTPKEYAEATKGLNVVKAVYMEVDVVPEQQQKEADYIVELCKSGKTPDCAAVVSGRPNSRRLREVRQAVQGQQVRQGHPAGAAREGHAGRVLPGPEVREGHSTARRAGPELRPVRAAGRAAGLREARRPVPEHAVHPRPLRQRRSEAHAGAARAVEEGHGRRSRSGRTSSAR